MIKCWPRVAQRLSTLIRNCLNVLSQVKTLSATLYLNCSVDDNPLHTTCQLSTHLDIAGGPNPVVVLLPE